MARHGENIRKRKDGRWEGRYIKGRTEKPNWAMYTEKPMGRCGRGSFSAGHNAESSSSRPKTRPLASWRRIG